MFYFFGKILKNQKLPPQRVERKFWFCFLQTWVFCGIIELSELFLKLWQEGEIYYEKGYYSNNT